MTSLGVVFSLPAKNSFCTIFVMESLEGELGCPFLQAAPRYAGWSQHPSKTLCQTDHLEQGRCNSQSWRVLSARRIWFGLTCKSDKSHGLLASNTPFTRVRQLPIKPLKLWHMVATSDFRNISSVLFSSFWSVRLSWHGELQHHQENQGVFIAFCMTEWC